jgi:hypothetical protein
VDKSLPKPSRLLRESEFPALFHLRDCLLPSADQVDPGSKTQLGLNPLTIDCDVFGEFVDSTAADPWLKSRQALNIFKQAG